jgi:hypothetical protein
MHCVVVLPSGKNACLMRANRSPGDLTPQPGGNDLKKVLPEGPAAPALTPKGVVLGCLLSTEKEC